MAGYLGSVPVPQATQHRETFTCTEGQTTFNTAGYTPQFVDVYLNGSHLSPADFTASNGSDVVLGVAASADDVCDIVSYTPFEVASQTFTGTTTMTDVVAATLDISGNIDIDGVTNLDAVDIDGAVDMASTLQVDGVLTTTAATVFNGGFVANDGSTITTADNTTQLTLASTDTDANVGPVLDLFRNVTGATNDEIGRIQFTGKNDAGTDHTYANISSNIVDATSSGNTEDGSLVFQTIVAGSVRDRLNILSDQIVINQEGRDLDFRVKSDDNSNMLVVNGGDDQVIIGGASSTTPVAVAKLAALAGVTTDYSGSMVMSYQAGTYTDYYKGMTGTNPSTGSARGLHLFNHDNDSDGGINLWSGRPTVGSVIPMATFTPTAGAVFNPDRGGAIDFRVASGANNHMLFVDASTDRIGIGKSDPARTLDIHGSMEISVNTASHETFIFTTASANDAKFLMQNASSATTVQLQANGASYFNGGDLLVGRTSVGNTGDGHSIRGGDSAIFSRDATGETVQVGRNANDGQLIQFRDNGSEVGDIREDGGTVSLTGFAGNHESSGISESTETGTVVSTIDELDTRKLADGSTVNHENHAKIKVSDSVGDKRVYGVLNKFVEHSSGLTKALVTSVGISSVKVTGACEGGDLLESNGDGTAKVQSDDIIKSKTIGKVTIGNSNTGVKLVSCVMYCG